MNAHIGLGGLDLIKLFEQAKDVSRRFESVRIRYIDEGSNRFS